LGGKKKKKKTGNIINENRGKCVISDKISRWVSQIIKDNFTQHRYVLLEEQYLPL